MNDSPSVTRILREDESIESLRRAHPDGLTFVVGDTHGEYETLDLLLRTIRFDPEKDHAFFVGDYNEGGDVRRLLKLLSQQQTRLDSICNQKDHHGPIMV